MRLARACFAAASVALCSFPSLAEENRFGDWSVGVMAGQEGLYAATTNDSGGLLGKYCLKEQEGCLWILANSIGCEDGSKYPVLVNADTGAASTEVLCLKIGGITRYAFANFDVIDSTIRTAEWIGVAFPLKSGKFQVSRFSMAGRSKAMAVLEKAMEAVIENATRRNTKDQSY